MALDLPVVNDSLGTWGTILNAALTDIDTRLTDATTKNTTQDGTLATLDSRVDTLENDTGGGGLTVATSGTQPAAAVGQVFIETDTGMLYYGASVNGTPTRLPWPGSYLGKARQSVAQTIANTTDTALTFPSIDHDDLGGFDGSTRYTCQAAGLYEFTGAVGWAPNEVGYRMTMWWVNGTVRNSSGLCIPTQPNANSVQPTAVPFRSFVVALTPGEYVEAYVRQNSGAGLATTTTTEFQSAIFVKYLGYHAS